MPDLLELTEDDKAQLAHISDLLFEAALAVVAASEAIRTGPVPALGFLLQGITSSIATAGSAADSILGDDAPDKEGERLERLAAVSDRTAALVEADADLA